MEILLLQTDISWLDPGSSMAAARSWLDEALRDGANPDIVMLPEMFATGFCMEPQLCSGRAGEILSWMKEIAVRYDSAVAGTVAVEEDGRYFNRFYFVRPDREVIAYDKRHLFTYAGEHRSYSPGTKRFVVRWRGFGILLQTCYDLRFPVFSRNRNDYDLAIYCANWPLSRIGVWDTLLKARAIENACYVAGVNRVGSDPGNVYPGRSVVIDYKGNIVAGLADDAAGYVRYSISLEDLLRFREKFPVLNDGEEFIIV